MMWIALLLLLFQGSAPGPSCAWDTARQIGTLEAAVNESSGMAISRRIPNRSYRVNDSGDSGRFFAMDLSGGGLKAVNIRDFNPRDDEDMALGPCDDTSDCLFIGDIGDNGRRRTDIELVVVREQSEFPSEIPALHRVRMQYPDGPHDAESLAVHPDGSVYIMTKDATRSEIFKLKPDQWRNPSHRVEMLEPVLTLDWPEVRPNSLPFMRQATAMDIAPDGKHFLLLNYADAMEFFIDLSGPIPAPATWKEGVNYRIIPLTTLEQEEAIAYLPDGRGFLYDTERAPNARSARIMQVDCKN